MRLTGNDGCKVSLPKGLALREPGVAEMSRMVWLVKGARRRVICQSSDKIPDRIVLQKESTGKVLIPENLWLELLAKHKQKGQNSSGVA